MSGVNEVEMTPKKEGTTDAVSLAPQNSAAATSATATPVATPPEKNSTVGKWRKIVENVTESYVVVAVMSILTMWAMFNDDIRLVATTKEADDSFEAIISVAFFLFVLEIFAQSFYKADYLNWPEWTQQPDETYFAAVLRRMQFGSFYFWLDWIATASLLFEMPWMLGSAYDTIQGDSGEHSTKLGSASKTGARAGRVVRLVRMARLVRMIKLYKYAVAAAEKKKQIQLRKEKGEVVEEEEDTDEFGRPLTESRVGAAMSDLTNRRVIVLILVMLIIIPLLSVSDADTSLSFGTQMLHNLAVLNSTDPATYSSGMQLAVDVSLEELPILGINFNNVWYYKDNKINDLRDSEMAVFALSSDGIDTLVTFDQYKESVQASLFSIYTTLFICFLLLSGTYFFSSDVNKLVIGPIEHLVELVRKISANPLGVKYKMLGAEEGFIEGMETTMLLTTIIKIGGLMRVGFGEAGASVITDNLQQSESGTLNLLGAGKMIRSIFGFCDVRQFTDTTECLQEEVMLFVNRIAHILHSIVVQCEGAANKNIGDAFLLTWKLKDDISDKEVARLADSALLAFCKSLIELSRYQDFICNFSVGATARLYKRFPNYNVRIGSGLHVGWAIEGAIGSNRKIDASYLSPHVNFTEFLESSTKAYGVPLLISEPFYKLLSPAAAKHCRQVDRIRRSANEDPIDLYTYDADLNINWNDPFRPTAPHNAPTMRSRIVQAAAAQAATAQQAAARGARRGSVMPGSALATIPSASSAASSSTTTSDGNAATASLEDGARRRSQDHHTTSADSAAGRRQSTHPHARPSIADGGGRGETSTSAGTNIIDVNIAPTITVKHYEEDVWMTDKELMEMRHAVSPSFHQIWANGMLAYIKGDWPQANDIFHETHRLSKGKDGPTNFILGEIKQNGGVAPHHWPGFRDAF